ncbi:MAG: dTDP-4-dehydrorhamnose reductase [Akkermansiaceae bacterium]|nr:dTDP-4-dehydrorhamnose reductase [Akkermansiaceae bacterium]NNM28966.1 dTDP-4-dehydrorhamnose reductase [Akkermansiaceae bacterium]
MTKNSEQAGLRAPREEVAPRRIAIAGAGGRLGQALVNRFGGQHTVIGLGHDQMDLAQPHSIDRALDSIDFDVLILTAALTAVDYCEDHESEAFAVNAEGPLAVARACARRGIPMVLTSTDFVFDGDAPGLYSEDDETNPISVYGASKLKGEEYVLDVSEDNLVVRLSWLFGPGKPAFPEWIIDKAGVESAVTLPAEKIGCPAYSPDVAEWLDALLLGPTRDGVRGIVHLCNSSPCSWREWGQGCIDLARELGRSLQTDQIGPGSLDAIPAFLARRPLNSAMSTGKLTQLTGLRPRPWREALREHVEGMKPALAPSAKA